MVHACLPVGRGDAPVMKDCLFPYELPMKVNNSSPKTWGLFEKDKERNLL
jgi:hypothetical protein